MGDPLFDDPLLYSDPIWESEELPFSDLVNWNWDRELRLEGELSPRSTPSCVYQPPTSWPCFPCLLANRATNRAIDESIDSQNVSADSPTVSQSGLADGLSTHLTLRIDSEGRANLEEASLPACFSPVDTEDEQQSAASSQCQETWVPSPQELGARGWRSKQVRKKANHVPKEGTFIVKKNGKGKRRRNKTV